MFHVSFHIRRDDTNRQDESSVEKMKADPKHQVARYQSTTRSPFADIDLQIMHHRPNSEFIRVSVKVVGRRYDARSRSASPALAHGDSRSYQTLPPSVTVWAMPVIVPRKNGEGLVYRAAVITDERKDDVFQQCKWKSGKDPIYLRHFDLGRRVAEKDVSAWLVPLGMRTYVQFIPALVEFFTDVQHIDPPGPDHDSWVFSVAAVWEARLVIEVGEPLIAELTQPTSNCNLCLESLPLSFPLLAKTNLSRLLDLTLPRWLIPSQSHRNRPPRRTRWQRHHHLLRSRRRRSSKPRVCQPASRRSPISPNTRSSATVVVP